MAKVTGNDLKVEVVYLVFFFLYIQDGISVFRLLSIDSRRFFLILQVTTIAEKLK